VDDGHVTVLALRRSLNEDEDGGDGCVMVAGDEMS